MLLATKDYSRIILIDCACECVTTHSQVYVVRMVCIVCVYVCMYVLLVIAAYGCAQCRGGCVPVVRRGTPWTRPL